MPLKKSKSAKSTTRGKKAFTHKALLWLITGGIATTTIILLLLIGGFKNTSATYEKRKLDNLKIAFNTRYNYLHKLKTHEKVIKLLETKHQKEAGLFLAVNKLSQSLDEITNIGTQNNLKITGFKPLKRIPGKFYNILPVHITLIGKYRNIKKFLGRLVKSEYIMIITKLRMTLYKREGTDISLNFIINLYYQSPEQKSNKAKPNA